MNTAGTVSRRSETLSGGVTDKVEPLPPLPNDPSSGLVAHYFTLSDGFPYTVYYPDTGEVFSSVQDYDVTFALYGDPKQESYMCYPLGVVTQKRILDVTRPAEVYKGYFNPDHATHQEKLVYKGHLSAWDGSDMEYFVPPDTDEEPLVDVLTSESYEIQLAGYVSASKTPELRILFG